MPEHMVQCVFIMPSCQSTGEASASVPAMMALTPEQTDKPSLIPFQREKFDVSSHSSRKSILFSFFLLILEDLHKDLDVYP